MADLSHLLGDVYGDDPDGETVHREPSADARSAAPDWADESVLDAAFANWTPGPPPDAPAAERDVFGPAPGTPQAAPLPDDLAAALSAALVGAPPPEAPVGAASPPAVAAPETPLPVVEPAPDPSSLWTEAAESPVAPVHTPYTDFTDPFAGAGPLTSVLPWQRGDDDILPRRASSSRRGRGAGLTFRRR